MTGQLEYLVSKPSATSCLPSLAAKNAIPVPQSHSDLVKFARHDAKYGKVIFTLEKILQGSPTHRSYAYKMDEKDLECVKDLHTTDPWLNKQRIKETKGGLLKDSYLWILDNPNFQRWRDDEASRLL